MMWTGLTLSLWSKSNSTMIKRWQSSRTLKSRMPKRRRRSLQLCSQSKSSCIWRKTRSSRACQIQVLSLNRLHKKKRQINPLLQQQNRYLREWLSTPKWRSSRTTFAKLSMNKPKNRLKSNQKELRSVQIASKTFWRVSGDSILRFVSWIPNGKSRNNKWWTDKLIKRMQVLMTFLRI